MNFELGRWLPWSLDFCFGLFTDKKLFMLNLKEVSHLNISTTGFYHMTHWSVVGLVKFAKVDTSLFGDSTLNSHQKDESIIYLATITYFRFFDSLTFIHVHSINLPPFPLWHSSSNEGLFALLLLLVSLHVPAHSLTVMRASPRGPLKICFKIPILTVL